MLKEFFHIPSAGADFARWQALASKVPDVSGLAQAMSALQDSDLFALMVKLEKKSMPPLADVAVILEALAASSPICAALLAQMIAGGLPVMSLGAERQKREWLTALAGGNAPALVRKRDAGLLLSLTPAGYDEATWKLRGDGQWIESGSNPPAFVVFAAGEGARDVERVTAFMLPKGIRGFCPVSDTAAGDSYIREVALDAAVDASFLLGPAGGGAKAALAVSIFDQIAGAAQANGIALAACESICQVLGGPPSNCCGAPHSLRGGFVSRLASLSASRVLLYEAAHLFDAGKDAQLISSMALLHANTCAENALNMLLHVSGRHPLADATRLQRIFIARQALFAATGNPEVCSARIANVILPLAESGEDPSCGERKAASGRNEMSGSRAFEILNAAANAFMRQGYDATTLEDIGNSLGMTKGSIYYHYRSKADLFVAVYRRVMERNFEAVAPIAEDANLSPRERLYFMALTHALQVMKHVACHGVMFQGVEARLTGRINEDLRAQLDEVIQLRDRYENMFAQQLAAAIEAGELPPQKPRLAVKPLFGAINWTTLRHQVHSRETAAKRNQIAAQLASFVLSGLEWPHSLSEGAFTGNEATHGAGGAEADKTAQILNAAAIAFTQQGYDAATINQISAGLGLTKGSIYYHYSSKADLFIAVYRQAVERGIETALPVAEDRSLPPLERLCRITRNHALLLMQNTASHGVTAQGLEAHLMSRFSKKQRSAFGEAILLRQRHEKLFADLIEEAAARGDLPHQDAAFSVKPLLGAVNGVTMWYRCRPGETHADRERLADFLAAFVMSGLKQASHEPGRGKTGRTA